MKFEMGGKNSKGDIVFWTTDSSKYGDPDPVDKSVWYYMKTVAVHEFGHTLDFDHNWRWPSSMGNPHEEAATIDAANNTLSWSVSSQPWHDGDKLMLRIHKAVPTP